MKFITSVYPNSIKPTTVHAEFVVHILQAFSIVVFQIGCLDMIQMRKHFLEDQILHS